MSIEIQEVGCDSLSIYATIPIAFEVRSVFRIDAVDQGLGGFVLREEQVSLCIKDYDAQSDGEDRPIGWAQQFDVSKWGFFMAMDGDHPVGGAVVAVDTPGVNMLEDRDDLAVLWDIRVHPDSRGHGVGRKLFQRAADWARGKSCTQLKIETQDVNVPACRFYARQGCHLGAILRYGYAGCLDVAHEAMLLWYLDL